MRRYGMEETGEQQVDDDQHVEDEDNMITRSKRLKKLATVIQHEQQVGDEKIDAHQGADNQNDEEEDVVRHSKRIKKLASVVQIPYTIPRLVKDMVYVRKNSWRS